MVGEDQFLADEHADDGAERIEHLREVQALVGALRRAHGGDHRIGRGLEERQPAGDDEQRAEEEVVLAVLRGRVEEQRAGAEQHQPHDDRGAVAEAPHEQRRRNREHEVADEGRELHEARSEVAQQEGLAELRDQHVVEAVRHAPEREQRDHEYRGAEKTRRDEFLLRSCPPDRSVMADPRGRCRSKSAAPPRVRVRAAGPISMTSGLLCTKGMVSAATAMSPRRMGAERSVMPRTKSRRGLVVAALAHRHWRARRNPPRLHP